jgi:monofunctional biosynthetic peptidoglycan transglycosylase
MSGKSFFLAGSILALVAAIVISYWQWLPDMAPLRDSNYKTTPYVRLYVNRMRRHGKRPSVALHWVALPEISPYLRRAVLMAEDDRFYKHHGVDWFQFKIAMRENLRRGRIVRGASTISQQVARNVFLSPRRRVTRKFKEILIARHIERSLSKDRILEIYLNIVEWGEGIFGAEAASQAYFGKAAADLTPEEAVALAAALPSPYEWNPGQPPDERTVKVRAHLLKRMRAEGFLRRE